MIRLTSALLLAFSLSGCIGTAVDVVTGTAGLATDIVVGTVDITTDVIGTAVDVVTPGGSSDEG